MIPLIPQSLNPPIPISAQPKILDFGVARLQEFDAQLTIVQTRIGQLVGTPAYMSPEQVSGASADVDTRSDVYAVGVLLYRLLCGRLPYEIRGQSLSDIASAIRDQPPAPLRSAGTTQRSGRFDTDVTAIVMKALAKERERRYQSAAELAADIRRYLAGLPIEAKRDSALYLLRTALKRYRSIALAGAALLLASLIFTTIALRQSTENRRLAAEAIAARDQATQQAETLRRSLYSSRLGYAFAAHYANDALRMGALLDQCPEDLRGWEWSFLRHLSDRSLFTMPAQAFGSDGGRAIALADGTRLVASHNDKTIVGYDIDSRTRLFQFGTDSDYIMLAAAPDDRRFALLRSSGDITVHDATTGQTELWIPNPPENNLKRVQRTAWDLSFSQDSRTVIAGGPFGHIWQWDASSGECLAAWRLSSVGITRLRSVPGSSMIVFCDLFGSILLWDVARAAWVARAVRKLDDAPSAAAVSPDGRWFATANGGEGIRIWELPTLEQRTNIESREMLISSIAFSPDSTRLISAGSERVVRQWNVATGEELGGLRGQRNALTFCAFADGGSRVVAAASNGEIKAWSLPARVDLPEMRLGGSENSAFALSRDGRRAAVADGLGVMTIVDAEMLEIVARFKAHVGPLYALEFSPDGSTLYSAGRDGAVYAWPGPVPSRETRVQIATLTGGARSLAISRHGLRLAVGGLGGTIIILDLARQATPIEFSAHQPGVRTMQFSPSGSELVSAGDDGAIRLWSAADGRLVRDLARHTSAVNGVAFDPSGRRIAAVGSDFYTVLFDMADNSPPRVFKTAVRGVSGCTFSPDGRRLLTCGGDRNVQIWDPLTGEELLVLTGHSGLVRYVRFSEDSRRLVSCGSDCTLRFWEIDPKANQATPANGP